MSKDPFYYSILKGKGINDIDKNIVTHYLTENPNLKRKGNEFFLKDFSWIESPAFVLGSRALYMADRWWCWPSEGESLLKKDVWFSNGSGGGSGAPRIFYENACYGVYDTIIRIKYGVDPLDLAWVYLKDNKIVYMNIKNDTFTDFDALLNRVKELSEVIR